MAESCPISPVRIDEHAVRSTAGLVAAITAVAAFLPGPWRAAVFLALAVDFAIRGFVAPRFSPIGRLGAVTAARLWPQPHPTDAAPKLFAARVGVVFALGAGLSFALGAVGTGIVFAAVLFLAAFLEAAFALCIGCKVYALLPEQVARFVAQAR